MGARAIVTGVCVACVAGAFGYAWWYDHHWPPSRASAAKTGSGSAAAAQPPGDAGSGRAELHARVVVASTWFDIQATGPADAARRLCTALVQQQQRLQGEGVTPKLVRDCMPAPLEPIRHDHGFVLARKRVVDEVDAMVANATGARGLIDELAVFASAQTCEQARQRLAEAGAKAAQSAGAAATTAVAHEVDLARRERDRTCAAGPSTAACNVAIRKLEILDAAATKARQTPLDGVPPCREE
jgi:hypothetical protein